MVRLQEARNSTIDYDRFSCPTFIRDMGGNKKQENNAKQNAFYLNALDRSPTRTSDVQYSRTLLHLTTKSCIILFHVNYDNI